MASNEVFQDGDRIALPVPAGTKAGAPLRIGGLNAVTVTDRAKTDVSPTNADGTVNGTYNWGGGNVDGEASCVLVGAHTFDGVAFAANKGDDVFITPGNALSATASGNSKFGSALSTKGATAGPLVVRITN